MRRIIHNTTAIAACLSMLAPHVASARMAAAETGIAATGQATAPAGTATGDVILLAQTDAQQAEQELQRRLLEAQQAKKKAERAEKRKAERREQKQEARKERAEQKADAKKAEKREEKAERKAEKEQRKQERKAAKEEKSQSRDAWKDEQRKAERQAERREEERRKERAAERRADELARKQREEELSRRQRQAQREAERARPSPVTLASSNTAQDRSGNMAGLGRLLDREVAGGLTEDRLACKTGGVYPCANGTRYVTPRGVVLERNSNGNYMLAPAEAQIYRVTGDGEVVSRDAGSRRQQSDAAREAARETRAANAAALDDRRLRRAILEQRITEANRRSSSQEFQGSLRDALARAERRQARAEAQSDDDDKSDLVKALLLGAGALAVGAMLNNNRQVALSTPDRVVVTRPDGSQQVIKDEVALLRQPGSTVTTEDFDDGSSRTIVTRPDGSKVVTIRDADLRVLRRTLVTPDGRSTLLIDDTATVAPVDISRLPAPAPDNYYGSVTDEEALRAALQRESNIDRRFTLGQIRNISEVRSLVAPVDIDAITFDTGSSAISPGQAQQLSALGAVIGDAVETNPHEMFLIEGHTDTVGSDATNLALSDRRAESVALALTEYFDVPPENLVVQGYGEEFPKIRAEGDIRDNRRASVRRITDLLQTAEAQ